MNSKVLTIVSLSAAVLALAAAVVVRSVKGAEKARYAAERAASVEETATRESRKAEADAKAAEAKARAAEAAKETAKSEAAARAADQKAKALEAAAAEKDAEAKAAARETEKLKAREASDLAAKAKADAARAKEEAERARAEEAKAKYAAEEAAAKLESAKAKADEATAAAKALELRKIDYETWQTRLLELEQDLAERERALRPETTIYNSSNITWVAEREPDEIGATGTVRRAKAAPVLPENDLALPEPTRRLARCERLAREQTAELAAASGASAVAALEKLYAQALEDRRIIDADYYARSIRLLDPQWVYRAPAAKENAKESSDGN